MRGLALVALLPLAAQADTNPYPPATCAALWEGFADLFGDEGERALAARFRAASVAEAGEEAADAAIARDRPWVRDLLGAYVLDADRQSRQLFERLAEGCGAMEADLP